MTRSNTSGLPAPIGRPLPGPVIGLVLLLAFGLQAVPAAAQDGLRPEPGAAGLRSDAAPPSAPHWRARFGGASPLLTDPSARLPGASLHLLGDYYWQGFRPARFGLTGGFRATSGLLLGERALAWTPTAPLPRSSAASPSVRSVRLGEVERDLPFAVPYVGVGYSGMSLRGGWGFTADLGLAGTGGGLQMRRDAPVTSRGADDILRELRLTPVLQIGASYAF